MRGKAAKARDSGKRPAAETDKQLLGHVRGSVSLSSLVSYKASRGSKVRWRQLGFAVAKCRTVTEMARKATLCFYKLIVSQLGPAGGVSGCKAVSQCGTVRSRFIITQRTIGRYLSPSCSHSSRSALVASSAVALGRRAATSGQEMPGFCSFFHFVLIVLPYSPPAIGGVS